MRLIDADALMKTLGITDMDCEKCAWRDEIYPVCNMGEGFADACSAIEDAPTIEERKKGRWKGEGLTDYRCSLCGFLNTSRHRTNYCGNCGADMRGEQK